LQRGTDLSIEAEELNQQNAVINETVIFAIAAHPRSCALSKELLEKGGGHQDQSVGSDAAHVGDVQGPLLQKAPEEICHETKKEGSW